MALTNGTQLGPYEILAPIASGGMGEVYRAKDTRLGRDVAVKVLPAALASHPEALVRFEREARAVAALTHPNILTLFDIGSEDGFTYAITELLEGATLRDKMNSSAMGWPEVMGIALGIAEGLAAAHAKGITHRDIKPENIFLTSYGGVKVLDFGLARVDEEAKPIDSRDSDTLPMDTEPGRLLGTVGYMSPEQARGNPPADNRSDVFSFGALCYEMLSGRRPFDQPTPAEIMAAILRDAPPPLRSRGAPIPAPLEAIVLRCLEKEPSRRYASGLELVAALKEIPTASSDSEAAHAAAPDIEEDVRRIAVLPLVNYSGDPEQEFFADGMTDALISNLAKIHSIRVISRTSVMRYKGSDKPLPEIARDLNVDNVLEGSVLQSGGRVRISTTLIDAASDRHLWGEIYERDVSDILTLQREVSRAIAEEIEATLTPEEKQQLRSTRPIDPKAHVLYLKGWQLLHTGDPTKFFVAEEYLHQSVKEDPEYAIAHSALAFCYSFLGSQAHLPRKVAQMKARASAARALELDSTSSSAHQSMALIKSNFDWDWAGAEQSYRRAMELSPGSADVHLMLARVLETVGRLDEAIEQSLKAIELDPASPIMYSSAAVIFRAAGRLEEAIEYCEKAFEFVPEFLPGLSVLAGIYRIQGRYDEAIEAFAKTVERSGGLPGYRALYTHALGTAGRRDEARAQLEILLTREESPPTLPRHLAIANAGLGNLDAAFEHLEEAFKDRSDMFLTFKVEPIWDSLRVDPRGQSFLHRAGLA